MRYGLFLGCAIPARIPSVERAAHHVLERLGLDAAPLEGATCCLDPIVLKSLSEEAWLAVGARHLARAAEQGFEALLTLCNGCFCSLNESARLLEEDPARRERASGHLAGIGLTLEGKVAVRHLAQVLDGLPEEDLRAQVVEPLAGRKVATFHGCHLVRPSRHAQTDDPVRPLLLDRLVERLGGEPVPYAERSECCGMGFVPTGEKVGAERLGPIVRAMADGGAEWIVTPCPSCLLQLETAQRLARLDPPRPVLHVAELAALALGLSAEDMGLRFHRIPLSSPAAAS